MDDLLEVTVRVQQRHRLNVRLAEERERVLEGEEAHSVSSSISEDSDSDDDVAGAWGAWYLSCGESQPENTRWYLKLDARERSPPEGLWSGHYVRRFGWAMDDPCCRLRYGLYP